MISAVFLILLHDFRWWRAKLTPAALLAVLPPEFTFALVFSLDKFVRWRYLSILALF
jgi:hypothetical protein